MNKFMETKFRKNIRLKHYDYASNGYYFVTICANFRRQYLSKLKIKQLVVAELALLEKRFSGLSIDYFVLMPNHAHIILKIEESEVCLSKIIQAFKSITTLKAKQALPLQIKGKLWQPNYYEHVIRDENALKNIREYIVNNPEKDRFDFEMFYSE